MPIEDILLISGIALGIVTIILLIVQYYRKSQVQELAITSSIKLDNKNRLVLVEHNSVRYLLLLGPNNLLLDKSARESAHPSHIGHAGPIGHIIK